MHPYAHVQLIKNSSSYFAQMTRQLKEMSDAIDKGEKVTLELKEHGLSLKLTVDQDSVAVAPGLFQLPREAPGPNFAEGNGPGNRSDSTWPR